ncbi:PREDICTED: nitric oxide synthase-like [Atta cephalotes]|uniref:nitric-oxide synthase (NADPH) n=1 Tax=Atta cephalotes TaxID=12957 RepID=A0A158P156_ATTCE|nr:PREDICTED: nitric oxide synthase-like [Atta cephalotes]
MKDHDGSSHQKKPTKLRNLADKTEAFDSLHVRNAEKILCTGQVCLGSIMQLPTHDTEPRTKEEILLHATDFLEQYFTSIRRLNSDAHRTRLESVQREVISTGTYQLTETELVFGAKLAWRNAARCIGRIQWSKLQVFDCRYVTTTSGMFEALCNHIKYSTNKGNIRSAITIFPQRTDGKHDYRVWNNQLINYAGYKNSDGTILGDPANVEFTEVCMKLGWKGARTRFDILPLVLSANGHDPDYFDIPSDLVLEVPLNHPIFKLFETSKHLKFRKFETYVQDLIQSEAPQIYKMVVYERGHFYVCGDCTMAEDVYQTLKQIIQTHSQMTDKEVEAYMLSLRDENRYHEDIFGITLRTAEVHNRSRETARIRMAAEP